MIPVRLQAAPLKSITPPAVFFALLLLVATGLAAALVPPGRTSPSAKPNSTSLSLAQQQDDDVVRVNTDLVVLNVTVIGKDGKFVSGLRRADFQILEDGKEQKLASFGAAETPFAVAIVIDTSGSMEARLSLARSAAIQFLDGLREADVAAVYNFDYKVEQLQDFSPGRDLPPKAFGLRAKTTTALND